MQANIDAIVTELDRLRETDPRVQQAWEVMTHKKYSVYFGEGYAAVQCQYCELQIDACACRRPHNISSWPDGAVRGMLMEAFWEMDVKQMVLNELERITGRYELWLLGNWQFCRTAPPDSLSAAFLAALKDTNG